MRATDRRRRPPDRPSSGRRLARRRARSLPATPVRDELAVQRPRLGARPRRRPACAACRPAADAVPARREPARTASSAHDQARGGSAVTTRASAARSAVGRRRPACARAPCPSEVAVVAAEELVAAVAGQATVTSARAPAARPGTSGSARSRRTARRRSSAGAGSTASASLGVTYELGVVGAEVLARRPRRAPPRRSPSSSKPIVNVRTGRCSAPASARRRSRSRCRRRGTRRAARRRPSAARPRRAAARRARRSRPRRRRRRTAARSPRSATSRADQYGLGCGERRAARRPIVRHVTRAAACGCPR